MYHTNIVIIHLFQNYFSGGYPRQVYPGHPGPAFRSPHFGKGSVEIPVHHESSSSSGRQEQYSHQHPQEKQQQKMPDPPVPSPQHAAPPFHLHSQKEAFLPEQAGEQGHPWPTHLNRPAQAQQQPPQLESDGAREIPIQHVSTYHIPASARQQQPPSPNQSADYHSTAAPVHPGRQGGSAVYTIPVGHEKGSAEAQPHPSRDPSPKKQYSAPPQPAAGTRQGSSPRGTPPPQQEARSEPPKPKTAEERAFEIIDGVMNEVKALEESVNNFQGVKGDKDYKYLEEMLTRSLLKLDSVEAEGHDNIRQARKNSVRMIEAALDLLELKAHANAQSPTQTPMDSSNHAAGPEEESPSTDKKNGKSDVDSQPSEKSSSKAEKKSPGHVKEMVLDSEVSC